MISKSIPFSLLLLLCYFTNSSYGQDDYTVKYEDISPGINQTEKYFSLLKNKKLAIVANQSSIFNNKVHLVDSLLNAGYDVKKVFCPEHGFRGKADAGAHVKDGIDPKTGLPIISLYGKNKKPSKEQLEGIDILIFDLQDVGVRFYTYISTMKYILEASAEVDLPVILLDRPNPNGFYVDGPILEKEKESFIGLFPIPVVYGLTIGELANMAIHEKWLDGPKISSLYIITCKDYKHSYLFDLPIKPSPNLPSFESVYLYPSLCFFEGTPVSVGRGTPKPFTVFGHPDFKRIKIKGKYERKISFKPVSTPGASLHPKLEGQLCYGIDLSKKAQHIKTEKGRLNYDILIQAYNLFPEKEKFFTSFFGLLAGTDQLKDAITQGKSTKQIRKIWEKDLIDYNEKRVKYLLYP